MRKHPAGEVTQMAAAIFALAGTVLGVVGALAVQVTQARANDLRARRDALRLACAEFTAAIVRMRNLAIESLSEPADTALLESLRDAHREARVQYERLRLTAASHDAQEAGRRVLRYAYGLLRQAEGKPPRQDEQETGAHLLLQQSLMTLYREVRRELDIPHPEDVYQEPDEWVALPFRHLGARQDPEALGQQQ
jgi:hypothetical protein